jgi:hypothetical protein
MADITQTELVAAIPAGDPFLAWWTAASPLPAGTTFAQFLFHTLIAANQAAATINTTATTGNKVTGYGGATLSAPSLSSDNVTYTIPFSATVSGKLATSALSATATPTNA